VSGHEDVVGATPPEGYCLSVAKLTQAALERLRDRLRSHGERPSIVAPPVSQQAPPSVVEAFAIVTEYGALCEAMFLMMLSDGRVKNVERDVLRGALRVISNDRVRSTHMESMLDHAAQSVAEEGVDKRLQVVIDKLREDPARAELAYVLAAAVAAADENIVPEEHAMLIRLGDGLGIDHDRADQLLQDLEIGKV
jgi:tellurite resistance protein